MGTLVLVGAVAILIDVGPVEQAVPDPLLLLKTNVAIVWQSVVLVLVIVSLCMLRTMRHYPIDSYSKILAYVLVAAGTNVLAASIGKLMQTASSPYPFLAVYLFFGAGNFASIAAASANTDVSLFTPMLVCVQLTLNCITGICVWQDWRVINTWVSYVMVYVLIIAGTYIISSLDLLEMVAIRKRVRRTDLTQGQVVSSFGRANVDLLNLWKTPTSEGVIDDNNEGGGEGVDPLPHTAPSVEAAALRLALRKGADKNMISAHEVIELAMMALTEQGSKNGLCRRCPPVVVEWLEGHCSIYQTYASGDSAFRRDLHVLAGMEAPPSDECPSVGLDVGAGLQAQNSNLGSPLL